MLFAGREPALVTERAPPVLYPQVQSLIDARLLMDDGTALSYRHSLVQDAVLSALAPSVRSCSSTSPSPPRSAVAGAPAIRVAESLVLGAEQGSGQGSEQAVAVLRKAADEIVQQDPVGATLVPPRHAVDIASLMS